MKINKKLKLGLVFICLVTIALVSILIYTDKKEVINQQKFLSYIEENTFESIDFNKLFVESMETSILNSKPKYKVQEFQLGLTDAKEIRLLIGRITVEGFLTDKKYRIFYNRDSDYFKIEKEEIDNFNYSRGLNGRVLLNEFNKLKKESVILKGKYDHYTVELLGDIGPIEPSNKAIYVWHIDKLMELQEKVEGAGFYIYGQPIKEDDEIIMYIIQNDNL